MVEQVCPICKKLVEIYIDKKKDTVHCGKCDHTLQATHFLKIQLKATNQVREKKKSSFSVKCNHCENEDAPDYDKTFNCKKCKKEIELSPAFKIMLKEKLSKNEP